MKLRLIFLVAAISTFSVNSSSAQYVIGTIRLEKLPKNISIILYLHQGGSSASFNTEAAEVLPKKIKEAIESENPISEIEFDRFTVRDIEKDGHHFVIVEDAKIPEELKQILSSKITVPFFSGNPTGFIDYLKGKKVMISHPKMIPVPRILDVQDGRMETELTDFTGTVEDALIAAIPKNSETVIFMACYNSRRKMVHISFGGARREKK